MKRLYRFFFLFVLVFAVSCNTGDAPNDGSPSIVDFNASSGSNAVAPGTNVTISWRVTGEVTTLTLDSSVGASPGDVTGTTSATVQPNETTTYTLTATNSAGLEDSATINVNVSSTTDNPTPPPPGEDTTAPSGTFGVSASQSGPFQNDRPNRIEGPDDERIVEVAPGETFYAQVAYSDPSGITNIDINLVNSNPPNISGKLDPSDPDLEYFTKESPVGACNLSPSATEVTCVYPISVSGDALNITELENVGDEFAYVFRTLVTDGAGNTSEELARGYVTVEGDSTTPPTDPNPPNPPNPPANQGPTAAFSSQQKQGTLDVQFNATGSSDPDGNVVSYEWDFGDGQDTVATEGAVYTRIYSDPDTYEVSLTVTDNDGATDTETKSVTVDAVGSPTTAPVIESFTADPTTIDEGGEATLSWSLSGDAATSVTIDNGVGNVTDVDESSVSVSPDETTTYAITATNSGGSDTATATVTVTEDDLAAPIIESFTADPNPTNEGDAVTLSWELSGGEAASLVVTDLETNQTRNVTGEDSTEIEAERHNGESAQDFRLTATNQTGSVSQELVLTVNAPTLAAPVIDSFTATPNPATEGEDVTLTWDLAGGEVTTLTVTDLETNGSRDVTGEESTVIQAARDNEESAQDFRLTATNEADTVTEELTLDVSNATVVPPPNDGVLVANDDVVGGEEGPVYEIDVIANDTYPDDRFPSIFVSEPPDNGTADLEDAQIIYIADDEFAGEDTFEYTLRLADRQAGTVLTDTATVTVNVEN